MLIRTAIAIMLAGSLTACGDKGEPGPSSAPANRPTSATRTEPSAGVVTREPSAGATGSSAMGSATTGAGPTSTAGLGNATFGGTVDFGDGITLHVSEPQPYELTEKGASRAKSGSSFVSVAITLTNDSDKKLQPSITDVTGRSGGAEAAKVFDTGVGIIPGGDLWPGSKTTWKEAFAIAKDHDLTLQIGPVGVHEGAVFTY